MEQMLSKINNNGWRWFIGTSLGIITGALVYIWDAASMTKELSMKVDFNDRQQMVINHQMDQYLERIKALERELQPSIREINVRLDYITQSVNEIKKDLKEQAKKQ